MNIFISHSAKDNEIATILYDILDKSGYKVWLASQSTMHLSSNIYEEIKKALNQADVVIAIITENFLNSSGAQAELGAVIFGEKNTKLYPLIIGKDLQVPYYLFGINYIKVDDLSKLDINKFLSKIGNLEFSNNLDKKIYDDNNAKIYINNLTKALQENIFTLVCGAGVSISAGIPDWNELLLRAFRTYVNSNGTDASIAKIDISNIFPSSSIILGKYLKIMLGDDFEKVIKSCLYSDAIALGDKIFEETRLIKAIVELIRPKRNKGSIESVISFNFDSLIEDALLKNNIQYKTIYAEGMTYEANQIPIFHVHGYLPRHLHIDNPNLVFSEDAYHTQFIDPFSWSNLIQLYKLMNNVCLFIGISLSDPNMRRLLDISKRKSSVDKLKHYIIKKMPIINNYLDELNMTLEEQDANILGLNVIWVKDYDEIPTILEQLNESQK